jgi:hypothetical protein
MPFTGNKLTSGTAAVTSDSPDVASIIDELSSSELSKTMKRFSRSIQGSVGIGEILDGSSDCRLSKGAKPLRLPVDQIQRMLLSEYLGS